MLMILEIYFILQMIIIICENHLKNYNFQVIEFKMQNLVFLFFLFLILR